MKNIGQYNQDLSVPRKKDIDSLETRVKTNEDNIVMAESDIEGLNTDVGTLKTDVSNVKTALGSKQDIIVGAASTIVENNLTKNKILVADDNGKVSASEYISDDGGLLNVNGQIQILDDMTIYSEDQTEAIGLTADGTDNIRLVASNSGPTESIECFFYPSSNKILFRHSNDNVTLTGIADATSDNDAVNLSQLNEVKNSITPSINENLLVNGYLVDPVHTFGRASQTISGAIQPVFNGWTIAGSARFLFSSALGYVNVTSTADGTEFYNVTGSISVIKGKTYTFSMLVSGDYNGVKIVSTLTNTASTSTNYDNGIYTLTFVAENNTGYVGISIPNGVGVGIYGAKLEEGSIQTLCYKDSSGNWVQHIPNKADELARCSQWNTINKYIGNALLPLSGGTMTGSINMGNQKITKLADGESSSDAVNLGQLDTKLNISGGTMTGNLTVSGASYPKIIVQATSGAGDGVLETSGNMTQLLARSVANDSNDYRGLLIRDANNQFNINKALQFVNRVGGTSTLYTVLHSGNVTEYAAPPIKYSTTDLTAGSSALATGALYVVYE